MVKVRVLKFVHYVANSQAGQSCRLKLLHFEPIFKLQLPNKLLQFNGKSYSQGLTIMSKKVKTIKQVERLRAVFMEP